MDDEGLNFSESWVEAAAQWILYFAAWSSCASWSCLCPVQPMEVFVDDETKLTLHGLQQYYCKLKDSEKNRKLFDLLDVLEFNQVWWWKTPFLQHLAYSNPTKAWETFESVYTKYILNYPVRRTNQISHHVQYHWRDSSSLKESVKKKNWLYLKLWSSYSRQNPKNSTDDAAQLREVIQVSVSCICLRSSFHNFALPRL